MRGNAQVLRQWMLQVSSVQLQIKDEGNQHLRKQRQRQFDGAVWLLTVAVIPKRRISKLRTIGGAGSYYQPINTSIPNRRSNDFSESITIASASSRRMMSPIRWY